MTTEIPAVCWDEDGNKVEPNEDGTYTMKRDTMYTFGLAVDQHLPRLVEDARP